ncbi:hypothetical protein KM043_006499 [Ampulex compressa]|nr:hypothetical protein KM043_006499 [Ampulex compressa]
MGVKDLWQILSPLCERKPMYELQGKTVAIDLSCWVVDSQTITDNFAQPKMYLRNLYFRTSFLLMQGISPVFVLEGTAPTLKHSTIAKRNDIRTGFQERKTSRRGGRTQFNRVLNECRDMLKHMGLACVQGHGEAEAMCAYLNEDQLVDGCISQDSDCFLYGAKVVYRNFCLSAQGNRGGPGGSVDEYNIEKIEKILKLGRKKMIALALLCGCDYDEGLNGVGKEAALKFFKIVGDEDVLERMKNWKTDTSLDEKEVQLSCSNLCTACGHNGKIQKHAKSGCMECGTVIKCNDSFREKRMLILNEVALRKKALLVEGFPKDELISEFLLRKDPVPSKLDLQWKQPRLTEFIEFMERHLSWEPQYAFEKIFPLVTRWQLTHLIHISVDNRLSIPNLFFPETIRKIRNIRSVASYELLWRNDHAIIERLKEYYANDRENPEEADIADHQLISIEPQADVLKCYPELVEAFENARNAKTKKRTANSRAKKNVKDKPEIEAKPPETKGIQQKRGSKKNAKNVNNRKIDEFVQVKPPLSLEDSFEKMSITPKRSKRANVINEVKKLEEGEDCSTEKYANAQIRRGPQFERLMNVEKINMRLNSTLDRMFDELSPDDFVSENEDGELNISQIIENICKKRTFSFNTVNAEFPTLNLASPVLNSAQEIEDTNDTDDSSAAPHNDRQCQLTNDSLDEFGGINESYVPLSQRIQKQSKESLRFTSKEAVKKFSLGVENLMNETDLSF